MRQIIPLLIIYFWLTTLAHANIVPAIDNPFQPFELSNNVKQSNTTSITKHPLKPLEQLIITEKCSQQSPSPLKMIRLHQLIDKAFQLEQLNNHLGSVDLYKQAFEIMPTPILAEKIANIFLSKLHDYKQAEYFSNQSIRLGSLYSGHLYKAIANAMMDKNKIAEKHFRLATIAAPNNLEVINNHEIFLINNSQ